jgi:hypothetical protein
MMETKMTNTALALAEAKPNKPALTTGNAVAAMVPNSVESAWRLSEVIARSGMAPKTYGTDPNKIMVGMLAGMEIGLTPFAALQSIAVINGNPSLWGDGALALVLASNLVEDMTEEDDGETATCTIKRVGRASPIVRQFSNDDAKRAGLLGKAGPWQQYPARMRQMRARAFALRDGFTDVLKGLRVAEEVRDYADFSPAAGQPVNAVAVPQLTGAALLEQAADDAAPAAFDDDLHPATPADDGGHPNNGADAGAAPMELPASAQEWIAETMRQVAACETIADLTELQTGKAKGLSRLEAFPKAHADVVALFNDRRAVIEGGAE